MLKKTNTKIWCINDEGDIVPAQSPSSQYRNRAYEDDLEACGMDNIQKALTCPIKLECSEDPVITTYGNTFKKSDINKVISLGQPDPLTSVPLSRIQLRNNNELKELARIYRSGNTPLMYK